MINYSNQPNSTTPAEQHMPEVIDNNVEVTNAIDEAPSQQPDENADAHAVSQDLRLDDLKQWLAQAIQEAQQAHTLSLKDIDNRIAEAEQKGYLRGRNEAIAAELAKPQPFANPAHESQPLPSADDIFLAAYREDDFWN